MVWPLMRISTALAILVLGSTLGCPSGSVQPNNSGAAAKAGASAGAKAPATKAAPPGAKGEATPTPAAKDGAAGSLLDPASATATAPDVFKVKLETTKGDVVLELHRDWSPNGADRFYNMVKLGFFEDIAFFRAMDNFMVQFGMHGDPEVQKAWNKVPITDDAVKESNKRGYVTFAKRGTPNSRTTQIFINYKDNAMLDGMGFSPFGQVVEGMDVVDSFYKGYGEGAPKGQGPSQARIEREGNTYLRASFPKLDYVKKATVIEGE